MVRKTLFKLILSIITLLIIIYLYGAISYYHKIKAFDERIMIGDDEIFVRELLGIPDYYDDNYPFQLEVGKENEGRTAYGVLYVYHGGKYLQDDMILIFDHQTRKLVKKSKGLSIHLIE